MGEIVRLSFDMDFFTNFIHSGFEDSAGIETRTLSSYEGRFERKISFTEEKEYTFGPYAFSFNGKAYVTNQVSVHVIEALPEDKSGIWLRYYKDGNEYILILEQRILPENKSGKFSKSKKTAFADI